MGQRLERAKARIREAGLAFVLPAPEELPARLDAVLAAIYAAYGTGWEDVLGADPRRKGLADEAIWLARVLAGLLPDAAEAQGLLALMLYCEARREARRDEAGRFVPLDRQDPERWSRPLVAEAEAVLRAAARTATPGRFQIEAAIQSVHVERLLTGRAPMPVLATLYELLAQVSPTIGVLVARAAAVAETGDPARALGLLDAIAGEARDYQPWWAARGRIAALLGHGEPAREALLTAAGLSEDPAVRAFLIGQAAEFEAKPGPASSMSDS
jgi:RNA polymerase sigma-70 factor (ECF subfamily)